MATTRTHSHAKAIAAGISTLYALIAGLWVYASDALIYLLVRDSRQLATLQSLKGLVFIIVTALLLYLLVSNRLARTHTEPSFDAATHHPPQAPDKGFFPYSWGIYTLLAIFLLLAGTIGGAGYMGYQLQKTTLQNERQAELLAVADGKAEQIAHWIAERQSDAKAFAGDPFFAREVERWLAVGSTTDRQATLLRVRLTSLRDAYDYATIALLDGRGRVRLSTDDALLDEDVQALALHALETGRIQLSDLHQHDEAGNPKAAIDMVVPLSASSSLHGQVRGAVYFQIDPQRYLFPLIQWWPTPSASAEILLVRREANTVLFLNQLRHGDHPALTLRLPLADPRLPAAMAAQGQEGFVEGVDYRRVAVLAAVRKVPKTPWLLLAKVDAEDVYAPLQTTAVLMTLLAGVFISGAGIGVGLWWQQQRVRFLAEHYRSELERRVLVQHYDYIARYANDIVLLMSDSSQILEANESAVSTYGYSREELLKLNIRDLRAPETHESIASQMDQVKNGVGLVFETLHQRKDGSRFPVEVSARLIKADGNGFIHSIIRNISERKRVEARMRQQETQLIQADKMAALGTLVSGVAHEINNPNHMIQMNAQSLLEAWADLADFLETCLDTTKAQWIGDLSYAELCETFPLLLQDIGKGAARIEKIVAGLKDFARPSDHTLASAFNLNEAVNQALSLLSHTIKKKTDCINVDLQQELPPLRGYIQQIEQVIVNLVLNALDALPCRSAGVCISTRLDSETNTVELRVHDEGVGIPAEHLQRIYEPFFTTKQARGGTGLGLFITYKLVTAHGGSLAFTSQPGAGTTARVKLPLALDLAAASVNAAVADTASPHP